MEDNNKTGEFPPSTLTREEKFKNLRRQLLCLDEDLDRVKSSIKFIWNRAMDCQCVLYTLREDIWNQEKLTDLTGVIIDRTKKSSDKIYTDVFKIKHDLEVLLNRIDDELKEFKKQHQKDN